MKLLLDENLDHRLRRYLEPHDAFTVSYMGWNALKNGTLLRAAEDAGFAALVTGDQTLSKEQNLTSRKIAIVVLSSIGLRIVREHSSKIVEAIDAAQVGTLTFVDCGVSA